jgi:hypothetical protein
MKWEWHPHLWARKALPSEEEMLMINPLSPLTRSQDQSSVLQYKGYYEYLPGIILVPFHHLYVENIWRVRIEDADRPIKSNRERRQYSAAKDGILVFAKTSLAAVREAVERAGLNCSGAYLERLSLS